MITSSAWRGKRYAVLGLARSGRATVDALLASGAEVVAWDSSEQARLSLSPPPSGEVAARSADGGGVARGETPSDGFTATSPRGGGLEIADPLTLDLTGFAAVIVSPGVPLNRHPIAAHAAKHGVPIIGDIELFAQARAELPAHKVVGITGTNGKSTTTALVHHILKTAGVPTTMGGNIGLPILGQAPLPEGGVYVLELSSYQIDLTFSLDCDVAVLLNITPDHLDRYDGFSGYVSSKRRLFEMQHAGHLALYDNFDQQAFQLFDHLDDGTWHCAAKTHGVWTDSFWSDNPAIDPAPALAGWHNEHNAALATWVVRGLGLDDERIALGMNSFPGLPHRMERVRTLNDILYVNDSKGTNADSTAPALAAYPKVRWILGGQAKTHDLDACAPHFSHVRSAHTIGEAGAMFADILRPHMPVEECGTLDAAVTSAAAAAEAGDTVLLSPACASFDQFRDFEDRGDTFRALVEAL